jgi:hypothetical protein
MRPLSVIKDLFLSALLLSVAAFAQDGRPAGGPIPAPSRANWIRQLIASTPKKITIDPGHPDYQLFLYEDSDSHSPGFGIKLCWLRLPKSRVAMQVSDVRRSGPSSVTYESLRKDSDLVVMNGGYFGYGTKNDYVPEGLVIADGKRVSSTKNWPSGGVVVQTRQTLAVLSLKAFDVSSGVEHAIQSRPMLIENGKITVKSDPKPPFNRSAVALDTNGDLIVAGAFKDQGDAVTLLEFSQFLATPRANGGPGAVEALNLDGSTDAHLYFPKISMHLGYGGENYVPNAIHFSLK